MTITAELFDGTKMEFPDGTDPSVIARVAKEMTAQRKGTSSDPRNLSPEKRADNIAANSERQAAINAGAMPKPDAPGMMTTALLGANQGVTFGFGDEIAAGVQSLSPNTTFDQALASNRNLLANANEANPKTAIASEIMGAITGGLGGAKMVGAGLKAAAPGLLGRASGGGLAGTALRGAGVGAVEGGLYGAGTADGEAMLPAIGKGAGLGMAMGGAAPLAVAGVTKAVTAGADAIGGVLPYGIGSTGRSNRALQTALQRSGMTVDQVDDAVKSAAREGQPSFAVADALGNPGQRALSGVARQPGDARKEIVDFLMKRQDGQGRRIGGIVSEALDAPDTALQRTAKLTADRGAAADTAYTAARGNAAPVDVRSALAAIDDRIGGMRGSGVVGDGIDGKLAGYRSRLAAQPGPDGVKRELSDFDRVLGVKQAVQDDIGAALRAGRNNEARELGKLQAALDASLEESSDMYRTANDGFRDASRVIDQIDNGKAATSGRVRAADTVQQYGKLTPDQQSAFRSGYADPVMAKIEGAAPGVNKARPLMDEASTAELGAMAKDPALLQRQLGRETTMFETGAQALGGSRTAENLQDIADTAKFDTGMIANLLNMRFGAAAAQLIPKLAGQNEATRAKIAQMLLSTDARGTLTPIAKSAAKSDATKRVIESLLRSTQRVTAN